MSSQVASLFATIGADASEAISEVGKFVSSLKGAEKEVDIYSQEMQRKLGLDKGMLTQQQEATTATNKEAEATNKMSNTLTNLGKKVLTVAAAYKTYKFLKESVYQSFDYANAVRDVQRLTGASAEEASKLIQISDQVGVSISDLTTGLQQAAKKGYEPSIAGIAKMSEEYRALLDPMERVQYLAERGLSGRNGGAGMAPLVELGSEQISEYGAGIGAGLVLSASQVYQARQSEFIVKNLEDKWNSYKQEVGTGLANDLYSLITPSEEKMKRLVEFGNEMKEAGVTAVEFDKQMRSAAAGMGLVVDQAGNVTDLNKFGVSKGDGTFGIGSIYSTDVIGNIGGLASGKAGLGIDTSSTVANLNEVAGAAKTARGAIDMAATPFEAHSYHFIHVIQLGGSGGSSGLINRASGTWGGANMADILGKMHGGVVYGGQHGMIVPPGFSNDGMPVMVSSGERLEVTPAGNKNVDGESKPTYKFYGPVTLKVDGKNGDFLRNFQQ